MLPGAALRLAVAHDGPVVSRARMLTVRRYPDLEIEDGHECLRFAAASAMERELPLPRSA